MYVKGKHFFVLDSVEELDPLTRFFEVFFHAGVIHPLICPGDRFH